MKHQTCGFKRRVAALATGFLLASASNGDAATLYRVDIVDFQPADVDNTGLVVGWNGDRYRTFLYKDGIQRELATGAPAIALSSNGLLVTSAGSVYETATGAIRQDLNVPASHGQNSSTVFNAQGINRSGLVVGSDYDWEQDNGTAVQSQNGQVSSVGGLGLGSTADAVNDSGTIAGTFQPAPGYEQARQAYKYADGVLTPLGTLGNGWNISVYGMNQAGQAVGTSALTDNREDFRSHAFVSAGNSLVDLGTLPGDSSSGANDINELGQAVGWSSHLADINDPNSGAVWRAVMFEAGRIIDLNTLLTPAAREVWTLQWVSAINDSGVMIGGGLYGGYQAYFVATPVPEVGCVPMVIGGLGVLALITHRRRRH